MPPRPSTDPGPAAPPGPHAPPGPSSALHGGNRAYVEALYAQWLEAPRSVEPSFRTLFEELGEAALDPAQVGDPKPLRRSIFGGLEARATAERSEHIRKNAGVLQLISGYRRVGHLVADLDPLGLRAREKPASMSLAYYGLSDDDLDTVFHVGRLAGPTHQTLREIVDRCERTYCGSVGVEFMYIRDEDRRRWLERRIEEAGSRVVLNRETALRVLEKMAAADHLETFIHTKYLGAKRFSVEGAEAVVPLLDLMVDAAAELGAREAAIGMAHRGRLNVLANVLGKATRDIFEEFEDKGDRPVASLHGDVKYHMGFSADVKTASGRDMHLSLAFNPSHLEFVAPVVEGQVRGKQDHFGDTLRKQALPIVIHGDAAIAGQGIVVETINLAGLAGYTTGGTIHVVINNQVGFTTPPEASRSSEHCTDVVKVILPPVLHVNADDLGAVAFCARLAAEYRQTFGQDIVIDLWCFRKYGHNEADEPAFTNPVMVQAIKKRRSPLETFVAAAIAQGVLTQRDVDELGDRTRSHLEQELQHARAEGHEGQLAGLWKGLHNAFDPVAEDRPTHVAEPALREALAAISAVPPGAEVHRKIVRVLTDRAEMARGERPLDWAAAELLAYATLLREGYSVRLTGQDSGRGTFSHRHAVLHDQVDGHGVVPLRDIGPGVFDVIDSPLSEAAALGFEYGYTLVRPDVLTLWEAQFGDFANGAQVIIDQFVCSSEAKWNRCSGLVMLLPHGYEGQGPEHSSARLERFLQLSGDDNWFVMNLTTPAQLFHALRAQMQRNYRKPLVLMTPKSLLRHPSVVSPLSDFASGGFRTVIDDTVDPARVERVIFCSGKVYFDLLEARDDRSALVRIEQLYPLDEAAIGAALARYPARRELVFCQEEPKNMGAFSHVEPSLRALVGAEVRYAGRARSASPATGSRKLHDAQQSELVRSALSF